MVLAFFDMSPGITLLIIFVGALVVYFARFRRLMQDWKAFRRWQASGKLSETPAPIQPVSIAPVAAIPEPKPVLAAVPVAYGTHPTIPEAPFHIDFNRVSCEPLPGAAGALKSPPTHLWYAIEYMRQHVKNIRFTFPLGWWTDVHGELHLAVGHFVDDIYNGLITALPGGGKDNLLLNMAYSMMMMYPPEQLQFVVLDGKGGADYQGWAGKEHVWHVAEEGYELADAMELLSALKLSRKRWLKEVQASSWDNYHGPNKPPLFVVIVSELSQLAEVIGESDVESWLMTEINIWRGLGLRLLVGTQNSSRWSKKWRAAIEFFCAGRQPSRDEVKPNTGKDVSELEAMGVIPPHRLPQLDKGRGVFTIVQGDVGITVRTTYLDDEQRRYWVSQLAVCTDEQLRVRHHEKARLLHDWYEFKAMVEAREASRQRGEAAFATMATMTIEKQAPLITKEVESASSTQPVAHDGYDRAGLERLLTTISQNRNRKLEELVDEPLFVQACITEYARLKSYGGVVRALWGDNGYSGTKDRVVKAALERAVQSHRGGQDDTFLQGLLAA